MRIFSLFPPFHRGGVHYAWIIVALAFGIQTASSSMRLAFGTFVDPLAEMYGWSNERAVFFSGVQYGRSPMIAVRTHPVKPRMVVYIKPKSVDQLAPKLADMERVVLVKTKLDEKTIIEKLRYLK